eukprot:scaffold80744_cov62-Phaeocystis_antarctica.AAC.2
MLRPDRGDRACAEPCRACSPTRGRVCARGAGCRAQGADRCAGAREFYCVLSVECCVRESSSLALFTQATRLVLLLLLVVVVVVGGGV